MIRFLLLRKMITFTFMGFKKYSITYLNLSSFMTNNRLFTSKDMTSKNKK